MADVFSTQVITAVGLRLAATATSSNPIVWTGALSCATVPQDPEDKSAYTGITGEIDTASATQNVARMVVGYTNNGQQPQQVKAIALLGRLANWADEDAVIAAYCYDNDSMIVFPATDMQRTRFAFNLIFNGVSTVTVTQTGDLTVADSERFVSCHIPGDPEVGEDQTIHGDKYWYGQQDFDEACRFHDTVVTHNVYPDSNATYSLGSSSYRWNAFYASSADITGNISSSGRLMCASAVVTGSIRADFVNARSKLALKASTFVGTSDDENNKYQILVSGGAIDGVYGGLTILPQAQLTDASTGTTYEQNVDVYIGAQDSKFQSIHVVGADIDYLFNKYWSSTGRQWRFGSIACGGDLIPNTNAVMGNTSVNLGASGTSWQNAYIDTVQVDTKVICPTNSIGQYTNGTLGDNTHYWWNTYTAYATVKNTIAVNNITSDTNPETAAASATASGTDIIIGSLDVNGFLQGSRLGALSATYEIDNTKISRKAFGPFTMPVGGMVLAIPSQAWLQAHSGETILPTTDIHIDGTNAGIWYLAKIEHSNGESHYTGMAHNVPMGHYRCLSAISVASGQSELFNQPILLQRIS